MSKISTFCATALLIISFGAEGSAQYTGSVTITGHISPAVNMRMWDIRPVGNISALGNFTENGVLSLKMDLIDNTLLDGDSFVGAVVTFALRSNTGYQLSATVNASDFTGISPQNVKFGIGNAHASGPRVMPDAISGARVTPQFAQNPFSGGTAATLADLTVKTALMSGSHISDRGNWNTPTNALLVETYYAIAPQFFTAPLTINITYTISVL